MRVNPAQHLSRFFLAALLCLSLLAAGTGQLTAHAMLALPQWADIAGIKTPICSAAKSDSTPLTPPETQDAACCRFCFPAKVTALAAPIAALLVPARRSRAFAPPSVAPQLAGYTRWGLSPIRGPPVVA